MAHEFPFKAKDGRDALVRPAHGRDATAVIEIIGEAMRDRPRTLTVTESEIWTPRDWRRQRLGWGPDGVTLVVEVEGHLAGSLDATRGRRPATRHSAQFGVTVARPYRDIGLGRALLEAVEIWAAEHGVERIELGVFPDNVRALHLYDRMGYEVEGTQRRAVRFPEQDTDVVLMAKLLPRATQNVDEGTASEPMGGRDG